MEVARETLKVVVIDSTCYSAAVAVGVGYVESVESNLVVRKMYCVAYNIIGGVCGLYSQLAQRGECSLHIHSAQCSQDVQLARYAARYVAHDTRQKMIQKVYSCLLCIHADVQCVACGRYKAVDDGARLLAFVCVALQHYGFLLFVPISVKIEVAYKAMLECHVLYFQFTVEIHFSQQSRCINFACSLSAEVHRMKIDKVEYILQIYIMQVDVQTVLG